MITSRFPLGDVSFTSGYFATLVGEAPNSVTVLPQWHPVI